MFLNWAYTNNGGKPIHHRIYPSHYILKLSALVSGAQRVLFQMVYITFNIYRLYLVNPHIFITSYLAQGPLKYSKIPWRKLRNCLRTMRHDIRTSGSHMHNYYPNNMHEQETRANWTRSKKRPCFLFEQISISEKYGCRLHTYCEPSVCEQNMHWI